MTTHSTRSHRRTPFLSVMVLLASVVVLLIGCEEAPPILVLRGNAVLDSSCIASSSGGVFRDTGLIDVSIATSYRIFPTVENTAPDSRLTQPGGDGMQMQAMPGQGQPFPMSFFANTNSIRVTSAEVSYFFITEGVPDQVTSVFNTTTLPVGSSVIDPGGSSSFSTEVLNSLQVAALNSILSGDLTIQLVIEIRILGVTLGQTEVESNILSFTLNACSGCLVDPTCSDNSAVCNVGNDQLFCTGTDDTGTMTGGTATPAP